MESGVDGEGVLSRAGLSLSMGGLCGECDKTHTARQHALVLARAETAKGLGRLMEAVTASAPRSSLSRKGRRDTSAAIIQEAMRLETSTTPEDVIGTLHSLVDILDDHNGALLRESLDTYIRSVSHLRSLTDSSIVK